MNAPFDPARRRLLAAAAAVPVAGLVAACAGTPGAVDGPPAPAPVLKPGDRWFYSGRDGFRDPLVWDETREVVRVEPGLVDVSYVRRGPRIDASRNEHWTSPGDLLVGAVFDFETRRFARPLPRWRYPLAPGDVWSLFADNVNEPSGRPGTINYHARVGGWRSIATPAGTFDAVGVRVMIRLDDEEFWRTATECNHLLWYAPDVGNTVREEREAQYFDKGDPLSRATFRSQHAVIELTSFRRA